MLDEIQRRPDIFPALRVLSDERPRRRRFLVLGSGGLLNWSELGRSMGVSDLTARRYADLLEGTLMVRMLKPWHANVSKRQVKAPKLYFRDSGMLHLQLGIEDGEALLRHPSVGASWEGFILEQRLTLARSAPDECYFWRTEHGAELDLLLVGHGRRIGIEVKRTSSPSLTPSMRIAHKDLELDWLYVIHAGTHSFSLAPQTEALSWVRLRELGELLRQGKYRVKL